MLIPLVQVAWCRPMVRVPAADETVTVRPEPEFPNGRKGVELAAAWRRWEAAGAAGMMLVDGDVAPDLDDLDAMRRAVTSRPLLVHMAAVRLWPASTRLPGPVWGHRTLVDGKPRLARSLDDPPHWCHLGLTWIPSAVWQAAMPMLPGWVFPDVDTRLSVTAVGLGIGMHVVRDSQPRHMHY